MHYLRFASEPAYNLSFSPLVSVSVGFKLAAGSSCFLLPAACFLLSAFFGTIPAERRYQPNPHCYRHSRYDQTTGIGPLLGGWSFTGKSQSCLVQASKALGKSPISCRSVPLRFNLLPSSTIDSMMIQNHKSIVHLMVLYRMNEQTVIIFRSYLRIPSASY